MKLCECGCGQKVSKEGNRFIHGHQNRGENSPNYGKHLSEETRKKISEALKGNKNSLGNELSQETRKKMSEARKGEKNHNYGIKLSEETKKKLSEAHKGIKLSEETRKKMSEAHKVEKLSEESRRKMSESHKGKKHSEETKRKISEAQKGENANNWQCGKSFEPYCPKFNNQKKEQIRNQYNGKCQICGKDEKDNLTKTNKIRKLSVHHVDLDKNQGCNGIKWNLIPLCMNCHGRLHDKKLKITKQGLIMLS